MLARLANVIFWICCGIAALSAVIGVTNSIRGDLTGTEIAAVLAAGAFGIGWAIRYVLAGRR